MNLVALGDIANFSQGLQIPIPDQKKEKFPGSQLFLRIINYTQKSTDFRYVREQKERYIIEASDIIMVRYGAVGYVGRGLSGILANNMFKIDFNERMVDGDYLYRALKSDYVQIQLLNGSQSTSMAAINFKSVAKVKLPLPPLEEQKKIAAILDAADDYRQKTKALIDKYDQLTQSLFLDMFGDPVTNPMGFYEGTIGDFIELITYGLTVRPEYHSEGIPLISAREIRSGTLDLASAPKIGVEDFKRLSEKGKPIKGDILFSKTGSIGHCAIVEVESQFAVTQNAARIVFMETVNRTYAVYFLRSPFIQTLSQIRAKGNAVKDLQLGEMKKFKFILPPSELQHQFAERVAQIEQQKQQAEASLVKAEELFSSLLQRAFKGELTS